MKKFDVTYYTNVYVVKTIEANNIEEAENLADDFDEEELEDDVINKFNEQDFEWEILSIDKS